MPEPVPRRFLALGDSYSIGEGVGVSERWPNQLALRLRARGCALGEPEVIARTGWSCAELAAALSVCHPAGGRELVSLMIGVNDQYRGYPLDDFEPAFTALLDTALALAEGGHERTLALSIPDWGLSPFARARGHDALRVAADIDARNAIARACCLRRRVPFVDITAPTRALALPSMWAADGLHPGPAVHAHLAELVLPIALSQLAR